MQQYSHWHYIFGYLIILTNHNWPVMMALAMTTYNIRRLYHQPNRTHVQRFYGWGLLVLAYEYAKHLGDEFARPVGFLFTMDWAWMVPSLTVLIARVPVLIMIVLSLWLLFPRQPIRVPIRHSNDHMTAYD